MTKVFLTSSLFLLLFISSSAAGDTSRRNFDRERTYDVLHYVIRVNFDRRAKKVIGETTIRLKPLRSGFRTAEFDAVGISFSSVTLGPGGVAQRFRSKRGLVTVTLDRSYGPADEIALHFKHTAVPKKGVYFIDKEIDDDGKPVHSEQIWTQGEPDEARHWFPSFDFPSDKATIEQFITAKAGETVIGNGELIGESRNADGTVTFHYRLAVPTPTYLVSFVIGEYARVGDQYREIPLGFYVYPGKDSVARRAFGDTKEMLRVFEALTGVDYPFNKYDQTIVSGFTFGGMENITATTMADSEIFAVDNPLFEAGVGDLVSHELAHSWFGNLVTCRNWAELWLNEGYATFMEAAFREQAYGRASYLNKIKRDALESITDDTVNDRRTGLFNQYADDVEKLFDRPATNYNKGGAVLHTLREEIGDAAFWKGTNLYLRRHKFANVESTDLRTAMEEASGRDLGWFFEQWVYKAGHPALEVAHKWDESTKTLRLTVTQVQKPDRITPAAFRLAIDAAFVHGTDRAVENLKISKRVENYSIKLPAAPEKIELDPQVKVPLKTVKISPL